MFCFPKKRQILYWRDVNLIMRNRELAWKSLNNTNWTHRRNRLPFLVWCDGNPSIMTFRWCLAWVRRQLKYSNQDQDESKTCSSRGSSQGVLHPSFFSPTHPLGSTIWKLCIYTSTRSTPPGGLRQCIPSNKSRTFYPRHPTIKCYTFCSHSFRYRVMITKVKKLNFSFCHLAIDLWMGNCCGL